MWFFLQSVKQTYPDCFLPENYYHPNQNAMKYKYARIFTFLISSLGTMFLTSCREEIDMTNRFTFKDETISSYLEKHDAFSEYFRILGEVPISPKSESSVQQLLSARGHYTVFAPTNQAINNYLDTLSSKGLIANPSWDAFTDANVRDSIYKVIVYNSIIDCGDDVEAYQSSSFPLDNQEFQITNMYDRKLFLTRGHNPDSMYVNGLALISPTNRDILAINGFVHQVESVVAPSNATMSDLLRELADDPESGFSVMSKLIIACGLQDTLSKVRDEVYETKMLNGELNDVPKRDGGTGPFGYLPLHRKYGFTIFGVQDSYWEQALGKSVGDISLEDVTAWLRSVNAYPNARFDTKYGDTENAINQFVTYHMLPMRIPKDKLVIHYNEKGYNFKTSSRYTIPVYELYTTMGKRRLIKLYECGDVNGVYINRFPVLDNGRHGNYHEVSCVGKNQGVLIQKDSPLLKDLSPVNGFIYPISEPIFYDSDVRNNLQRQRLRFDVASIFPEFMNNDIRGNRVNIERNQYVGIPPTREYAYLEDLVIEDGSYFYYLLGLDKSWHNYMGDELNVTGQYEMTFRLPPVPQRGTYEIRYAVQTDSNRRGMCQVYFGDNPDNLAAIGIPLDLRMGGLNRKTSAGTFQSIVGWEADKAGDDEYNAEVDKKMRNNGFMKGPEYYPAGASGSANMARSDETNTRRIIVRQTMDPDKTYYLRFKSVLEDKLKEFYMDFLELCSKEVYDNPVEPEDIW